MTDLEKHQDNYRKASEIAFNLEKKDLANAKDLKQKWTAYAKSSARYELISELIKEGIL